MSSAKLPVLPSSPSTPTVAEVEADGVWVCERNSGFVQGRICHWVKAGLMVEGVDWKWEQVLVPRPHTGPLTMRIRFYRRTALAETAQKKGSVHSEYMSAKWEASREIVEQGRVLLREDAACELLGVTPTTLWRWTDDGCDHRPGGACLGKVKRGKGGSRFHYWFKDQLEKVNLRKAAQPRELKRPGVYTSEEVHNLTGLSRKLLRRKKERKKRGLLTVTRKVMVDHKMKDGSVSPRLKEHIVFTRASVDAYLKVTPVVAKAPHTVTTAEFAEAIGLGRKTVNNLCTEGRLGAVRRSFPTGQAMDVVKKGWLIPEARLDEAKRVKASHQGSRKALLTALRALWPVTSLATGSVAGEGEDAEPTKPEATRARKPTPGPGRPKGKTDDVKRRELEMLEKWDRGEYGTNKAKAARANGFHRPDAAKVIITHEEEKRRNNSSV